MTVCLCGNINQDIIFSLDRFPGCHEKVTTRYYYIGQGGSAANTAWWLARMGADARMVGCVGRDRLGDDAIEDLKSAGVDTTTIGRSCRRTGLATIISCGQDKRMIKVAGANNDIPFDEDQYDNASHIHMSSVKKKMAESIVRFAERHGITVSWDPSDSLHEGILDKVDYLFMNEDEYGRHQEEVDGNPPGNIVVTMNGGGCVINGTLRVRGWEDEALDTTGAGDAFDAGFIYGLTEGFGLEECGRWGVACTALNVRNMGSRDGFSSKEELIEMVKMRA
ncbi:MAG TPA: PfkB family carbohydrate kinase [Candidatus Methanofastidiosa archaeon]|nr:PfkB family carbohydrate kinase [Candidatus Methanofastidiosa archaeon]